MHFPSHIKCTLWQTYLIMFNGKFHWLMYLKRNIEKVGIYWSRFKWFRSVSTKLKVIQQCQIEFSHLPITRDWMYWYISVYISLNWKDDENTIHTIVQIDWKVLDTNPRLTIHPVSVMNILSLKVFYSIKYSNLIQTFSTLKVQHINEF